MLALMDIDRGLLAGLAGALAAFCATLALAWPLLAGDRLGARMQQAVARGPRAGAARPAGGEPRSLLLRQEPRRIYARIVDRLRLGRHLEDGTTQDMLRVAGFRGRAPVIAFLALRVLAPVILFAIVSAYVFLVIQPGAGILPTTAAVLVLSALGYFLPGVYVRNRTVKRQASIRRSWPDALDLLLICVESGMSAEHAFRKVAGEVRAQSPELADELTLTTAELSVLPSRRQAYENLGRRTDLDSVKSVVSGLMQSEQYGTPLGQALRVLAQESRALRMSEAERKAASLSPKLTVPMILFFLPVLFAVIITPAAIQIMGG